MNREKISVYSRKLVVIVAIAFGMATIFVGFRTLFGFSDPGYTVFLPLLVFNSIMGFVYIVTGFLIWQNHKKALPAAKAVFLINLLVLLITGILYLAESMVAVESVTAMTLRTVGWLVIYGVLRFQ